MRASLNGSRDRAGKSANLPLRQAHRKGQRKLNRIGGGELISIFRWMALFSALPAALASDLRTETLSAWDEYIQAANASMLERLRPDRSFLWIEEHPHLAQQLHSGNLVIAPAGDANPKHVPSGLIHHWIGAIFLPNARISDVLSVVRDYDHYRDYYPSAVLASKCLGQNGADDRFSLLLISKMALAKTAIASQDQATFYELDPRRWYSTSSSTRIQEIDDYGGPDQHLLPPDQGHGYIWRLYGIARYEQRDGGVYLEMEAMALSRDIPAPVRWFVDPLVRRLARDSISTTLRRTGEAVSAVSEAMMQPR
ncbi:MAG TPA: hypothetical protein VKX39_00445 [Bryobacteraceae bacterium]|nr:hypothetical protein [Bryobacteraceae bacterium]